MPHPSAPDFQAAYEAAWAGMPDAAHLAENTVFKVAGMNKGEIDAYFVRMQTGAKMRARQIGREYCLPKFWGADQYIKQRGQCALTGNTMRRAEGRFDPLGASIDRIDSAKGYTPENCQLVMMGVNLAKRDLSEVDFVKMCRAVVSHARRTSRERIVNDEPPAEPQNADPTISDT